jgi:LPPG:FO 2-phospho-L-lactate transferase
MGLTVALAGGVGAARLLRGLVRVLSPENLMIVGNTGDDVELYELHICPDLDIVMYTLAGIVDEEKGWGVMGDTFHCLDMMARLGLETWFRLGDRDLAIHLARTELSRKGMTLSQVTAQLCRMLGLKSRLVPMTDDQVRTKIVSCNLKLDFQEYFVKRGAKDDVAAVIFEGADKAKPSPGIIQAISKAERIVMCPSNPILSIAPILAIPTVRERLEKTSAYVVGISPIVGGKAIKGPTDRIMTSMGLEASAYGVAKYYGSLLDHFIIDAVDADQKERIERLGMEVTVTNTIMRKIEDSVSLARIVTEAR